MKKTFKVKSMILIVLSVMCMLLAACSKTPQPADKVLDYRIADKSEGIKLILANEFYYNGFTQNDLDFRMQKTEATLEEYKVFMREQVRDFTDEQKAIINEHLGRIINRIKENGYKLPELEQIIIINTTMLEECSSTAYTHGTQIYINGDRLSSINKDPGGQERLDYLFSHELFHCMTRCSSSFRTRMYKIIHFTTQEEDFVIPPSVKEYFITNPDVERHNSYATFMINGEAVDCFTAFVTVRHFEKEGDRFQDCGTTALVPVDGRDTYYVPRQARNFDEVFGTNTDYVIDPEECMATNFGYLMAYEDKGPQGNGYPNPEIITSIADKLKNPSW